MVAPEKNPHQPAVVAARDDLPLPSGQASSFGLRIWHTTGTLASRIRTFLAGFAPVSTDSLSVRLLPKEATTLKLRRFETGSQAATFVGFRCPPPA
jgi:hypothetical protein